MYTINEKREMGQKVQGESAYVDKNEKMKVEKDVSSHFTSSF
jgi:hypothetical protein